MLDHPDIDPDDSSFIERPIEYLVRSQKLNLLKVLLGDERIDPNARDKFGCSVLHMAASHAWLEGVALLLGIGADVNIIGSNMETPLHDATRESREGSGEVLGLLLKNGANVHLRCDDAGSEGAGLTGATAIHFAALRAANYGEYEPLALLVAARADLDATAIDTMNNYPSTARELYEVTCRQQSIDDIATQMKKFADVVTANKPSATPKVSNGHHAARSATPGSGKDAIAIKLDETPICLL